MKCLIIKTSSLGDIVHCFPAVQYLRQQFPDAQIDWVVEKPFASLLEAHPEIHKVLQVDTKLWRTSFWKYRQQIWKFKQELQSQTYDYIFDLQGNLKSGLITFFAKGNKKIGFGFRTAPEWPNTLFTNVKSNPPKDKNIREDYLFLVQHCVSEPEPYREQGVFLKHHKEDLHEFLKTDPDKIALVCPGSAWTNKQMTEKSLGHFLSYLQARYGYSFLLIWGNEAEKDQAYRLCTYVTYAKVLEKVSIPFLQNIMGQVGIILSMDSLPLHLAGTTTTPSYSIFGPSSGKKYVPLGQQHGFYQGLCPYGQLFEKRCPKLRSCSTGSCIKDIDLDNLKDSFDKWHHQTMI